MTGLRCRRTRGSQGGYALIAVLVSIVVFSLLVVALLGLVLVDTSSTASSRDVASIRRAGDGALQSAIAQLKSTSRDRLLATDDPCAGLSPTAPASNAPPPKIALPIDRHAVEVDCTVPPDVRPTSLPATGTGTTLTLLGGYDVTVDTSGAAFSEFVNNVKGTPGRKIPLEEYAGLIHFGERPARIWGDVKTRQWMLGSTPRSQGKAIEVTGSYAQGDAEGGACGAWAPASVLFDRSFEAAGTKGRACGNGSAAARQAVAPDSIAPAADPGLVDVPTPTCTAGPVVELSPGKYDKDDIDALNTMFGSVECNDRTFWFPDGSYSFDAVRVATGTDYFKSGALVFDDPTSEFVFGTPSGWDPTTARATAAFPEACDRTKAGVSIVLGPTTSIQQVRGMVAMCGTRQGGVDLPMISQQGPATLPDESWAGVPTAVTAAYNTVPTPDAVKASVAVAGGQPDGYPALGRRYQGTESTRASSTVSGLYGGFGYRLAGLRDDGSRPSSRVISKASGGSAKVKLIGSSSNVGDWQWDPANVGANRLIAKVVTAESPPRECYAVRNGALPNVVGTVEIDLLSDPACAQIITSAQVLESATVEVTIIFNANLCVWFCQQNASYSLDYAWVETHTGSGPSPNPPPMNLNIDPLTSRSFNAYGNLQVPRTQIDVKWHGLNAPLYEVPVFVGEVTARALASSTEVGIRHIGPLASKLLVPSSRSVVLRAVVDGLLVATARIDIADLSANGTTLDPANHLNISDWRYCNKPKDSTTC